jgi:hypothetical protein
MISVHLAEKLGYRFDREYVCYWVNKAQRLTVKNPDKSRWPDFCGEYEELAEAFMLKKVWVKDGDLYGLACNDPKEDYFAFKLLPIGENTFGRAKGNVRITFGDNCLVIDGITCKKL